MGPAVPLLVESTFFGVLIAARRAPHSFGSVECGLPEASERAVGLALNQTQLYAALQAATRNSPPDTAGRVRH